MTGRESNGQGQAHTDWLREARWGVFAHYLADVASATTETEMSADDWNRRVDAFDAGGLARQLAAVSAGYYGITVGQNSGFYCAPNATYEEIVGRRPGRCSRRDLIADLHDALAPHGIRLMVYVTNGAPSNDPVAAERLHRFVEGDERKAEMQRLWNAVLREWSLRWAGKVSAWWVDGVYHADAMYRHPDEPHFGSLLAALRAGNPDSLVALNPGLEQVRPRPTAPLADSGEDYLAGEVDFALPVAGRWYDGTPAWPGALVNGEQFHLFTFLGAWWGIGEPRFPVELTVGYTKHVIAHGGAMTWDVPCNYEGLMTVPYLEQLAALKSQ